MDKTQQIRAIDDEISRLRNEKDRLVIEMILEEPEFEPRHKNWFRALFLDEDGKPRPSDQIFDGLKVVLLVAGEEFVEIVDVLKLFLSKHRSHNNISCISDTCPFCAKYNQIVQCLRDF